MSRMLQALKNLEAREAEAAASAAPQPAAIPQPIAGSEQPTTPTVSILPQPIRIPEVKPEPAEPISAALAFADSALAFLAADPGPVSDVQEAALRASASQIPSAGYQLLDPISRTATPILFASTQTQETFLPWAAEESALHLEAEAQEETLEISAAVAETSAAVKSAVASASRPPVAVATSIPVANLPTVALSAMEKIVRKQLYQPETLALFQQMVARVSRDVSWKSVRTLLLSGAAGAECADLLLHLAMLLADEGEQVLVVDGNITNPRLAGELLAQREEQPETGKRRGAKIPSLTSRVLPLGTRGLSLLPLARYDLTSQDLQLVEKEWEQLLQRYTTILVEGGNSATPQLRLLGQLCDATYLVVRLGTSDTISAQAQLQFLRSSGARVLGCLATVDPATA